jgi:preprotein translocase subunit Sss1
MGWMDWGKKICGVVTQSTLDITASALGVCGTLACIAGGVGFAVAQGLEKTFRASYWGLGSSAGGLDVTARLEDINFGINYTLPIHVRGIKSSEQFHNLADYVDSSTVQIVSAALLSSGMALRGFSSILKKFQQSQYALQEPAKPSQKEYLILIKNSLLGSLSIGLFSNSITSYFVFYSNLLNSDLGLTYPFSSERQANSSYYNGPLMSTWEHIHLPFDPEIIPIKLPIIGHVDVSLNMSVKGVVNVTAGGGLFFEKNGPTTIPPAANVALSAIAGVSAYLASNFFSRKEQRMRDERLLRNGEETSPLTDPPQRDYVAIN